MLGEFTEKEEKKRQKTKDKGQKTKDKGQKTKDKRQRTKKRQKEIPTLIWTRSAVSKLTFNKRGEMVGPYRVEGFEPCKTRKPINPHVV